MASCERCFHQAQMRGITYYEQVARAERDKEPCTTGPNAPRLRAGEYWDEMRQVDRRDDVAQTDAQGDR